MRRVRVRTVTRRRGIRDPGWRLWARPGLPALWGARFRVRSRRRHRRRDRAAAEEAVRAEAEGEAAEAAGKPAPRGSALKSVGGGFRGGMHAVLGNFVHAAGGRFDALPVKVIERDSSLAHAVAFFNGFGDVGLSQRGGLDERPS